ncbi:MAG: non-hydrolyzing UDP-N-acetylglucosamine 2-epimerase [Actinomycetes bacterium]
MLSVVGARPEFLQVAPLVGAARARGVDHVLVHTGQHYDPSMSQVFFDDLRLPVPDVHLGIGPHTAGRGHGVATGAMLAALDPVLASYRPDWVVVFGDTNSTLAGALSAVKQHLAVAHVEAGLRSGNRAMPEEHNRVLVDHAADVLFAPTAAALASLAREGLAERTVLVGDIKTEITRAMAEQVRHRPPSLPFEHGPGTPAYLLATVHRAENVDDPERLARLVEAMAGLEARVVLLAHPRLRARARAAGLVLDIGALHAVDPLGYPETVAALLGAAGVITDSGGLQKEAFLLRVPCTTVRTETEWPETLDGGWNVLCPDPAGLPAALSRRTPSRTDAAPYGTGDTAARILTWLDTHRAR